VIANKMNLPATQPLGLMMVQRGGGLAAMPVSPSNSGVSGDRVRVEVGTDAWCIVDGGVVEWDPSPPIAGAAGVAESPSPHFFDNNDDEAEQRPSLPAIKSWRPRDGDEEGHIDVGGEWVVNKAHWRLRAQPAEDDARIVEVVMQVVRLEAWTGERARNGRRDFLL
jgi:hypothetical protein